MKANHTNCSPSSDVRGFTLIELLVTVAVFSLLLLLLVQATVDSQTVTSHQLRQMESIGSARLALDTLNQDINTLVTRGGATILFKQGNSESSDIIKFISITRNSSSNPNARMGLLSYAIESSYHPGLKYELPMLMRGVRPLLWPQPSDSSTPDYNFVEVLENATLAENDMVSECVFRMEILWLRKDGQITRDPRGIDLENSTMKADGNGYVWVDLKEVRGFIISIAALDKGSAQTLAAENSFSEVQQSLPAMQDENESPQSTPANEWNKKIPEMDQLYIKRNLRVVQRTYYLPN